MAKSVRIPRTGSPRRALTQLAGAGATGALHIGTDDCLYLVNGEVVFAESSSSPSIGDLLTASDRLAPQTWLAALATGGAVGKADVRPPAWLVQQGHLTHGELELCVLGAIYDAAYFALGSASALLRFVDGETHGMGAVTSVDPAVLAREVARRRKLLDEIYHEPGVDHAVVVPVRRPPVPRVVLSALQWEIVGRADGTLTPIRLARELGRAGYAVLTEVRRLAAAGLIALPAGRDPAGGPRRARRAAADAPDPVHRRGRADVAAGRGPGSTADGRPCRADGHRPRPPGDEPAPPIRAAVPAPAPPGSLPALPRRAPGERLPDLTDRAAERRSARPGRRGAAQAHPHRVEGTAVSRGPPLGAGRRHPDQKERNRQWTPIAPSPPRSARCARSRTWSGRSWPAPTGCSSRATSTGSSRTPSPRWRRPPSVSAGGSPRRSASASTARRSSRPRAVAWSATRPAPRC